MKSLSFDKTYWAHGKIITLNCNLPISIKDKTKITIMVELYKNDHDSKRHNYQVIFSDVQKIMQI